VLDNLALESRVRAAFMADPRTEEVEVTVVAGGDTVALRGMVEDDRQVKAAQAVAESVAGVKRVQSELRTMHRPRR